MKPVYGQKLYYTDEHNDDFTHFKAELVRPIDGTYRYETRNPLFRLCAFVLYYLIAFPLLFVMCKAVFGVKVVGKKNVRKLKGGYVLYANHVHVMDCALAFVFASFPRRSCIVCNPDAVHMPVVRVLVKLLGALPVPDDMAAFKTFTRTIDGKLEGGKCVVVMPEAHIWPYYTGIRDFPATSFMYAAKNGVPAVPMCTTFRRPRGPFASRRKPRVTVNIGAPIMPDAALSMRERARKLRDEVHAYMTEQAKKNECAYYVYEQACSCTNPRYQISEAKRSQKLRNRARRKLRAFGKATYRYAASDDAAFKDATFAIDDRSDDDMVAEHK